VKGFTMRSRREAERFLETLRPALTATAANKHVDLWHGVQRLAVRLRAMSRPLDSELNRLVEAARILAYRSGNDRKWQQSLPTMMSSRDSRNLDQVAEFRTVRKAFDEVNRLVKQLAPDLFEPDASSRPDITKPGRRIIEVDRAGNERLMRPDDPILTGEMVPVESSNVSSVGFDLNERNPERSTMRIQYLQPDQRGGKRKVPGPVYAYSPVSHRQFRSILRAGRKGSWIWDNLRVRGSIAGFRIPYSLIQSQQGNVPRRATMIAGQQWLIRRRKQAILSGGRTRTVQSSLPSQRLGSTRTMSLRPDRSRRRA
jgi:hypothetical protein